MPKVLITTSPFCEMNKLPFELLNSANIDFDINAKGRRLEENELVQMIGDYDALIAGTEKISQKVINAGKNLKFISRVGIGLDNVDLISAKNKNVKVSYTPDAPAPAVAELTIGLMLSLLRFIHVSNIQMHKGEWNRYFGRRIPEVTIGIIGAGRIGCRVLRRLKPFGTPRILVNDIHPDITLVPELKLEWVGKDEIYKNADLISLHLPLTVQTKGMIKKEQLMQMKSDALIINTSRGGIIDEEDLYEVLESGHLAGAAIDVFEREPYAGNLNKIERCILTSHMGSMSIDCRSRMEIEATEEIVRFFKGEDLRSLVPKDEYDIQSQM